jgi:hypothetical protein
MWRSHVTVIQWFVLFGILLVHYAREGMLQLEKVTGQLQDRICFRASSENDLFCFLCRCIYALVCSCLFLK